MKETIRKILKEEFGYKQQLFNLLRTGDSDNIEMVKMISQGQGIEILELLIDYSKENPKPPYFKLLNHFDLSEDELINVLSKLLDDNIHQIERYSNGNVQIIGEYGYEIYFEYSDGSWIKHEYDDNGNQIYSESSNGRWSKWGYDDRGNEIYYENGNGDWEKMEYDKNRNLIYSERSDGYWLKREYDEYNNLIYYKSSDSFT
jgi:hypothetical protein